MKKIISMLLSMLFILPMTVYAESSDQIKEITDTESFSKAICTATIDDDFKEFEIIVSLTPEASEINKTHTPSELSEKFNLEIVSVQDASRISNAEALARIDHETYCQILLLKIDKPGKQAVLDAIKIIEQHEDVKSASPNYIITLDPVIEEIPEEVLL